MNKLTVNLSKKQYFIAHSLLITALMYYFSLSSQNRGLWYIVITFILITGLFFLTHRPNTRFLDIMIISIPSLLLAAGFFLSYHYFPNLSKYFKLFSAVVFLTLFYLINLVNNVFLVVHTRKEIIPLYRVALTWSKILSAFIAIPLLAGVFKVPLIPAFEAVMTSVVALLFLIYFIWALQNNPDIKFVKRGESLTLVMVNCFIIGAVSASVSFFPNETFLRALLVSSVLIFCTSYLEGHLKNSINKKLIIEHFVIFLIFLLLLLVFNP